MIPVMKAHQLSQHPDHAGYDPDEASCPPEVLEIFQQRIASLEKGKGLSTPELREKLRTSREKQATSHSRLR